MYARLAGADNSNAPSFFVTDERTVSPVLLSVRMMVTKPMGRLVEESRTIPLIVMSCGGVGWADEGKAGANEGKRGMDEE